MQIQNQDSDSSDGGGKNRQKTSDASQHDAKHGVRQRRQNNKICNERQEGDGAKIVNENGCTEQTGGKTSNKH